ncbi:unnamed protein product [Linum trigynum]|uniref:Uncharacterized protein n=1 Tax=Linum trigynum TaxID=586398 RepID=A0AAV2CHG1_9ROSI
MYSSANPPRIHLLPAATESGSEEATAGGRIRKRLTWTKEKEAVSLAALWRNRYWVLITEAWEKYSKRNHRPPWLLLFLSPTFPVVPPIIKI